jgi:O-antigen ligase/tetratricopeptide (TPR) repeat protein
MFFSRKSLDAGCERGILALLLGMLVFAPLAFGAVDEWSLVIVQGMAAVIFALWGAHLWLNPKPKLLWPPLAWVVAIFAVYAIARYFTSDIEYVARGEVIQVLLLAVIFFVVVNCLYGQDEAQTISFTLITLATLISVYAVAELITHSDRVWNMHSGYVGRAGGTYISPNDLAGLLGMLLPLALAYLLVGRVGIVTRILLLYAVVAMLAGLSATFSRAGWVASGMGVLFVLGTLLCHRNHRLRALLLLLALLAGGGIFVTEYLSKTVGFEQRVVKPDTGGPGVLDFNTRFELWRACERMWQDHYWFGVGPAHFDYRFPEYRPAIIQERPNRAHNDYLNLLADWGTVGGAIVLSGLGIFMLGLWKTWPHVRRAEVDFGRGLSNRFAFFLGASGGLFSLAVHSVADFNLHIPANALVGVTLLALLSSNLRFATAQYWRRAGAPTKLAFTIALAATTILFVMDGWRRGHEAFWLGKAERQEAFSPEKEALLQKAFASEPQNFQTAYDIGECLRNQSFAGGDDFANLAHEAGDWYSQAIRLNPYYGYSFLRTGMCLDWLGQSGAAEKYYEEAEPLDPNGYFMVANIGWHYVQIKDYAMARQYFLRSMSLDNSTAFAQNYLSICEKKMLEKASGQSVLPFDY